jgi:hypothetical protein
VLRFALTLSRSPGAMIRIGTEPAHRDGSMMLTARKAALRVTDE